MKTIALLFTLVFSTLSIANSSLSTIIEAALYDTEIKNHLKQYGLDQDEILRIIESIPSDFERVSSQHKIQIESKLKVLRQRKDSLRRLEREASRKDKVPTHLLQGIEGLKREIKGLEKELLVYAIQADLSMTKFFPFAVDDLTRKQVDLPEGSVFLRAQHKARLRLERGVVSPNGDFFVARYRPMNRSLYLYDKDGYLMREITVNRISYVVDATFSADSKLIMIRTADNLFQIQETVSGVGIARSYIRPNRGEIFGMALSTRGSNAIVLGSDGTHVLKNGKFLIFKKTAYQSLDVSFISDDRFITLDDDGYVRTWSLDESKARRLISKIRVQLNSFDKLVVSPSKRYLALFNTKKHNQIEVYDLVSMKLVNEIQVPKGNTVHSLAFSPTGEYVVVGMGAYNRREGRFLERSERLFSVSSGDELNVLSSRGEFDRGLTRVTVTMDYLGTLYTSYGKAVYQQDLSNYFSSRTDRGLRMFNIVLGEITGSSSPLLDPSRSCLLEMMK